MNRGHLLFHRPAELEATRPPEARGVPRDRVRLMVTTARGTEHDTFLHLSRHLRPGDLLVVNESQTLPASLPARGPFGEFLLNLSTHYGGGTWLAEPRHSPSRPGPDLLSEGLRFRVGTTSLRAVGPHPGLPRFWFVRVESGPDLGEAMARWGEPVRYGYLSGSYPLASYQTFWGRWPGSAEMPSASRPFTETVGDACRGAGVGVASVVLHCGLSSQEVEAPRVEDQPFPPEPFEFPEATARAVNQALRHGRRVVAVGTTVARALESAWHGGEVRPRRGFTRRMILPDRPVRTFQGLITGFHDPSTSHLALLYALAGEDRVRGAYREAVARGYLWHEFGDSHLLWAA